MQKTVAVALLAALSFSTSTFAQTQAAQTQAAQRPVAKSAPVAVGIVQTVPDAVDTPYPGGTMALDIDASDVVRSVYRVRQTIPVAAGTQRLTLLFPQWLPGKHAVAGTLAELVDLRFLVDGKPIKWTRDPVEVFSFHLDLPAGTREVIATFVAPSPFQSSEGRVTMTREMLNLQWEKMSLYPAGHYVRQIRVKPTVKLPEGWLVAGALDGKQVAGDTVSWAEVDYETLVDSPLFAGKYMRRWDLGHDVAMNAFGDTPELLEIAPENLETYRAMVDEALLTFGAKHFDHYDFLLALSDRIGGIGLEHHRSSENQQEPKSWIEWKAYDWDRNVIPHEFGHSWSGKYRRPAKLWTPDYRQPMQDNLLWMYEGQDQFWGYVHAARSGVQSKEMVLATFANYAGAFAEQPGRGWRSVEDTTHDPIFANRKAKPYASLARNEDYYTEGALTWLEADQIIRKGTAGRKSLDDFAKAFYGMNPGDWGVLTYEFEDIVSTLNGVYPYDWATFLTTRLQTPNQPAPLAGIEMGGYKLVWKEEPNVFDKAIAAERKSLSLTYSLGFSIDKDGKVGAPQWGSPGFNAGIVTGVKIVAVNGGAYDQDKMKKAITDAKTAPEPIQLLVQRGDRFDTIAVDYHGGLRYPWLERAAPGKAPTGLDLLLAPRRPMAKGKK
jgi:predicted metalloprotease with PDZ domain